MSANACIVYFGLKIVVQPDEIGALEARTDPRIIAARDAGLRSYWGDFPDASSQFKLFVGAELAIAGEENALYMSVPELELQSIFATTRAKLKKANFEGHAMLHVQWISDT